MQALDFQQLHIKHYTAITIPISESAGTSVLMKYH